MFSPLIMFGKYITTLDGVDNDAINEQVLARREMKLDDNTGNTFAEDSYYPETKECDQLIEKVNAVIQTEVNQYFRTFNTWAHILDPKESTMYHSHENPSAPPGISWVYYSKTDPKCGNIVWCFDVCKKRVMMEHEPKVGELILFPNFIPHFTKKNNSGEIRISISGNASPAEKDFRNVEKDPGQLFNFIGICQ